MDKETEIGKYDLQKRGSIIKEELDVALTEKSNMFTDIFCFKDCV